MTPDAVVGVRGGGRAALRTCARLQKGIIVCIPAYVLGSALHEALPEALQFLALLLFVALVLFATVLVTLLALKLYPPVVAVALGVFTLVPCVGAIALLVVSGKTTFVLQNNGIPVGLTGADMSRL